MNINSYKNIIGLTTYLSIAVFVISLTQKSFCIGNECSDSLMCLLIGWIGVFNEIFGLLTGIYDFIIGNGFTTNPKIGATFSWLANPFIFLSIVIIRKNYKIALILSLISIGLILSFLMFDSIFANEAGHYNKITSYELGYWMWLLSSITILIGSIILMWKSNNKQ